jgi:hypothetical protein
VSCKGLEFKGKLTNGMLDAFVREIYHRLSTKRATARETVLIGAGSGPITIFFTSISHNHLFVACVAMVVLLAEVLPISLSNLPYRQGLTAYSLLTNIYMSIAILGIMLGAFLILFIKRATSKCYIEVPESFTQVMMLVANSHWREDLYGLSTLNKRDRNNKVNEADRRYSLIQKWSNGIYRPVVDYAEE